MDKSWIRIVGMLLLVGFLVGFISLTTPLTDRCKGADADGRQYTVMAGDTLFPPEFGHYAPFCYRVATTWIASKVPAKGSIAQFSIVARIDCVLMLILAFALLRALGFEYWTSLAGMTFYAGVFWTLKFSVFSPAYIDHMTQVIALLILWVMAKKWWFLLPPLMFGAYFQKESLIALVPVIMIYYLSEKGWKWIPLYILGFFLAAASVIPYFILRNNVHQLNPESSPFYALSESWKIVNEKPGYLRIMVTAMFSGLGIMPLIILSQFRWVVGYLRKNPHWIAMILIGIFLLFGGKDKPRLMLYALPAFMVMTVSVLQRLKNNLPVWTYRAWLGIMLGLNFYFASWFSPFVDFMDYLDHMVPEHSPGEGALGFDRAVLVTLLFLLANYVLVKHRQVKELRENP